MTKLVGSFLIGAAITLTLLIIGITNALSANISGTFTYPTKFVDGSSLALSQIERMRVEYGSCNGTAFGTKAGEVLVTPPATAYTITGLTPGPYCLRAFTKATTAAGGLESDSTNVLQHSIAWPKPEPGVLVTVATTARLWNERWDVAGAAAGKVDLGIECGEQMRNTWHVIDRSQVRLNGVGERHPNVVLVARCG